MDSSPPGFSVHGILQARILEWLAIPFSRGSSQPRDGTLVSCIAGRFFTIGRTDFEADIKSQLTGKDPDGGKDRGQEEKGAIEDEMVGWHHRLNGH